MQGGSPALLFSFADTRVCGVGSHQASQPPSCLQLIRTAGQNSFRKGHKPVFGAAPTTAAGRVGLPPAWIIRPCLLPCLSPRQGCSGQPENKRNKKGRSTSLKRGPSPPFSVPAGTTPLRAEGLGQHFQAAGKMQRSHRAQCLWQRARCAGHVSYFCTVTSAQLLAKHCQHGQLSSAQQRAARLDVSEELSALAAAWSGSAQCDGADHCSFPSFNA